MGKNSGRSGLVAPLGWVAVTWARAAGARRSVESSPIMVEEMRSEGEEEKEEVRMKERYKRDSVGSLGVRGGYGGTRARGEGGLRSGLL